jgi:hypothetical protein
MKLNNEYTLLDYEFANGRKKLKVVLTYFNDLPKIDIREYYFDESDSTFKHSKKGIQLDAQKAEALKAALEQNTSIIDQHLLSDQLESWVHQIRKIETSSDFFSNYEFYKTKSSGGIEEIIFNSNHPFGKKLNELDNQIKENKNEINAPKQLMEILKVLLISYNQAISQFDDNAKVTVSDFIQDHNQTWSSLLKRIKIVD